MQATKAVLAAIAQLLLFVVTIYWIVVISVDAIKTDAKMAEVLKKHDPKGEFTHRLGVNLFGVRWRRKDLITPQFRDDYSRVFTRYYLRQVLWLVLMLGSLFVLGSLRDILIHG